jgi:hypothetical protein
MQLIRENMSITKTLSQPFVKFYNFIQREFVYPGQYDTQSKYLPFGVNDNFPNELASLVEGSPTATSCLSTVADFITGEGFNLGPDLENLVINAQGQKFLQFHTIQSDVFTHYWGVATLIKYNQAGQITQFFDIPFGYCRLGKPDDKGVISKILYNPYFGTAHYRSKDNEEYDVYNPSAATIQATDKKWKGQIFWMARRTRKDPFYTIPDYYSAKTWMNAEKNEGVYVDENLESGFLTPAILKLYGDPNEGSGVKDSNDKEITKGEMFDKEMSSKFQGAKRVGQLMAFWASNKEEFPTVEAFPSNGNAEAIKSGDELTVKKITVATKVPAILANISEGVSLGGDGNTIRAAVKLMQQRVKRQQSVLIDYYAEILSKLVNPVTVPISIVPYNPFPELESIDPLIWAELTPEEKRKWIEDHTEIELIDAQSAPVTPTPAPETQNRFTNLHFNSYPKKAKENVKRALEWQDKMGAKCLKPKGRELSQKILDGVPLGPKDIKRLSRYLSKQTIHANKPYDGETCDSVLYDAWGGSEMMMWSLEKMKELNGETD